MESEETRRIVAILDNSYQAFNKNEIAKLLTENDKFLKATKVRLIMRLMKDAGIISGTKHVSVKCRIRGLQSKIIKKHNYKVYVVSPTKYERVIT